MTTTDRAIAASSQKECVLVLAAWRIQTGLSDQDYNELKAKYLAKSGKENIVFNYMWYDHSKITHKIEDVGSLMVNLNFRTLDDLQKAWRHIELRNENFDRIYWVPYKCNLTDMMGAASSPPRMQGAASSPPRMQGDVEEG